MRPFLEAALLGAVAQEALHWYDIRGKLDKNRFRALLYSKEYWAITALVILITPVCCWYIIADASDSNRTAFIAGASFPLIFKKAVSAFAQKDQTPLGDSSIRDYFLLFTQKRDLP
jgi:hypothetical protein